MTVVQETVVLEGHIIDSLILAKVLDTIVMMGGTVDLGDVHIGVTRDETSYAKIVIRAGSTELLADILEAIQPHGAAVERESDCSMEAAPEDGVLPEGFYATSHLPTQVRLGGGWVDVEKIEMDLAIHIDRAGPHAVTVSMSEVQKGDLIVTGREGVRVFPLERPRERTCSASWHRRFRPNAHTVTRSPTLQSGSRCSVSSGREGGGYCSLVGRQSFTRVAGNPWHG